MSSTQQLLLGLLVTAIGCITLANPGGWDWLSALNIFMGGVLIGMGIVSRIVFKD